MILAFVLATIAAAPQPLTLSEALRVASGNPAVQKALAQQHVAEARMGEAESGYLPQGNAQVIYQRSTANFAPRPGLNFPFPPPSNQTVDYYQGEITITEPVWDFGRTQAAVQGAQAAIRGAGAGVLASLSGVAFQVRTAYYAALAADESLQAARETEHDALVHLAAAQARLAAGTVSPLDVAQAEVSEGNAQIALVQAQSGQALAIAQLATAMGVTAHPPWALVEPSELSQPVPGVEEAVRVAAAHRPERRELMAALEASEQQLAQARSAWFPIIAAQGQLSDGGLALDNLVWNWFLGGTISIPFLSGGADYHRLEEARAAVDSARADLAALDLQIRLDVTQALLNVAQARARLLPASRLVAEAREQMRLAEGRYLAGAGSELEVTDAQASLASALATQVQARLDQGTALAQLLHAEGLGITSQMKSPHSRRAEPSSPLSTGDAKRHCTSLAGESAALGYWEAPGTIHEMNSAHRGRGPR